MSRWLDLTSGYLLHLQSMNVTSSGVRSLISRFKSVQSKLESRA